MNELVPFAKEPQLQVEILIQLVSSQFDVNRSVATHLPINLWKSTLSNLSKIINLLEQNPSIVLQVCSAVLIVSHVSGRGKRGT